MGLIPKNWTEFQHYHNRRPPWIKLHRALLDDFQFSQMPAASRALAPLIWLLASEYEGGMITASLSEIAFRMHLTERELVSALNPLIQNGFIIDASIMLAERKQSAILEREKEEELEKEKISCAVAPATRTGSEFENFWRIYPKREGANPRTPAEKKFLALVASGVSATEIIEGTKRYAAELRRTEKLKTPFVATAVVFLNQRRWLDYPGAATAADEVPPHLRPPPGCRSYEEIMAEKEKARETARAQAGSNPGMGKNGRDHAAELPVQGGETLRPAIGGEGACPPDDKNW